MSYWAGSPASVACLFKSKGCTTNDTSWLLSHPMCVTFRYYNTFFTPFHCLGESLYACDGPYSSKRHNTPYYVEENGHSGIIPANIPFSGPEALVACFLPNSRDKASSSFNLSFGCVMLLLRTNKALMFHEDTKNRALRRDQIKYSTRV